MKIYFRGKFISASGKDVAFTDPTDVTNNFHCSLYSQCNVTINGFTITQASKHENYLSYLETLMNYGTDAAATHRSTRKGILPRAKCCLAIPRPKL